MSSSIDVIFMVFDIVSFNIMISFLLANQFPSQPINKDMMNKTNITKIIHAITNKYN